MVSHESVILVICHELAGQRLPWLLADLWIVAWEGRQETIRVYEWHDHSSYNHIGEYDSLAVRLRNVPAPVESPIAHLLSLRAVLSERLKRAMPRDKTRKCNGIDSC